MATLAFNSGLWMRLLFIEWSPFEGRHPAFEVNDVSCPENQTNPAEFAYQSLMCSINALWIPQKIRNPAGTSP